MDAKKEEPWEEDPWPEGEDASWGVTDAQWEQETAEGGDDGGAEAAAGLEPEEPEEDGRV